MTRPPAFRVLTNESDSTVEIAIQGELDLATAPQLEAEFERVGALDGIEVVVVDLRELAFLDSTGLEAIVKFDARSRADGVELAAEVVEDELGDAAALAGRLRHAAAHVRESFLSS